MSGSRLAGSSNVYRRIARRLLLAGALALAGLAPSLDAAAEAPGLATVTTGTALRAQPDPSAAVLASLGTGTDVVLSGSAAPDFVGATHDGQSGWVAAGDLSIGGRIGIPLEDAELAAPILAAPLADAEAIGAVPAGGVVILTGANVGGYVAASYEGTGGWISEADLGMPYDADHSAS